MINNYAQIFRAELARATGRQVELQRRGSWWAVHVHGWGGWPMRRREMEDAIPALRTWPDGEMWAGR